MTTRATRLAILVRDMHKGYFKLKEDYGKDMWMMDPKKFNKLFEQALVENFRLKIRNDK